MSVHPTSRLDKNFAFQVHNSELVPFCKMPKNVQAFLCVYWKDVEWYSRDQKKWVPNVVCPRQWNSEAYRVPPPK